MSISTPQNLSTIWGIITIASIGVGCVIIPCSIIAQLVCPVDLIGTITAITLSIRYIGGAIAFTVYDNILYRKFNQFVPTIVAPAIVENSIVDPTEKDTIGVLVTLAAQAKFSELKELIDANPAIRQKTIACDVVIKATQDAYAFAFRYPYWISILFGVISLACAFFLKDVRTVLKNNN